MNKQKPLIREVGFTLIELLVVISIIGLLSSIVLVSVKSVRDKARDAVIITNIKELTTAMHAYYNEDGDGHFPWGWENGITRTGWQDTPCNSSLAPCNDPGDMCKDYSNSSVDIFLEQLVNAGYFSNSSMDSLLKNHTTAETRIEYWYSCDLQDFRMRVWLSDGTGYEFSTPNYYNRWYYTH